MLQNKENTALQSCMSYCHQNLNARAYLEAQEMLTELDIQKHLWVFLDSQPSTDVTLHMLSFGKEMKSAWLAWQMYPAVTLPSCYS